MKNNSMNRREFVGILGAFGATALLGLAGCTSNASSEPSESGSSSSSSDNQASSSQGSTQGSGNGKVLVAYFTSSGHTRNVAERIATDLDATLFEITPANAYSNSDMNFNDPNSRVSQEHDNPDQRDTPLAQTTPDNFDQYSTVFIGYPIWWGGPAWPINHFVTDNDFGDKRVITFCTSESSGIGSTTQTLSNMANGGNWESGRRFAERAQQGDIDSWVQSLNI